MSSWFKPFMCRNGHSIEIDSVMNSNTLGTDPTCRTCKAVVDVNHEAIKRGIADAIAETILQPVRSVIKNGKVKKLHTLDCANARCQMNFVSDNKESLYCSTVCTKQAADDRRANVQFCIVCRRKPVRGKDKRYKICSDACKANRRRKFPRE